MSPRAQHPAHAHVHPQAVAEPLTDREYERDPGLAAERTELAWDRSMLALFGCGAAIAKGLPKLTGTPGRPGIGVAIFAAGALAWLAGVPYARMRRRAGRPPSPNARSWALAVLSLGTVLVGVAALSVDVFFPS